MVFKYCSAKASLRQHAQRREERPASLACSSVLAWVGTLLWVTLLGGDVKLVVCPMRDAYGCCSGVEGGSTTPVLMVPFLARQRILLQGAGQLSHDEMQVLLETPAKCLAPGHF